LSNPSFLLLPFDIFALFEELTMYNFRIKGTVQPHLTISPCQGLGIWPLKPAVG
jgi:hypothetical protein